MAAPERLTRNLEMLRALLARTEQLRASSGAVREQSAQTLAESADSLADTQARIARCISRIEASGVPRDEIESRILRWKTSGFAPEAPSRFDVVALVTSAGGLEALGTILHALPQSFGAAIIVAQHMGGQGSALVEILSRHTSLPVAWLRAGEKLERGTVHVVRPRRVAEVHPDGTCAVDELDVHASSKPLDSLLESLADSYGERAIGVVLTGMGRDGAQGAAALKRAGGTVIVQSEDTAERPSMPRAAIESGAADVVLALQEIGPLIDDIVAGAEVPRPRTESEAAEAIFAGPGELRELLRSFDWSSTALGPVTGWPESLRVLLRTILDNKLPMAVWWGSELIQIYNDAWREFLGAAKHPAALAGSARDTWAGIWPQIGPMIGRVMHHGEAIAGEDYQILIDRQGRTEEMFVTFSYAPIRDERGAVLGVHNTGWETTQRVVAERRIGALRTLATQSIDASSPRQACELAAAALATDAADVPFALVYLMDQTRSQAALCGAAGLEPGSFAAPRLVDVSDERGGSATWPLARAMSGAGGLLLDDVSERFRGLSAPAIGMRPSSAALLIPLPAPLGEPVLGAVVFGLSAHRPFDEAYRIFLDLAAAQIAAGVVRARARQLERERTERLAELDRAKTEFFSNVSHEFRTPLTLMLGPLDELQRQRSALPENLAGDVSVAADNARRLLNLVNTLLDFSLAETGRLRAHYEPVDLAALTADIASVFRSAVQRAGLTLTVDAPALAAPVWVDRAMWEKIVSNLLANAFKFTFEGSITVQLRALPKHAELQVRDTGVGIPAADVPHVFKRFHRARSTRARTHEGAGIGLALVNELVRCHHGRVRVESCQGRGTTFTVWLPMGSRRLGRAALRREASDTPSGVAATLAKELERWTPGAALPKDIVPEALEQPTSSRHAAGARVLVVDDNADMREYLRRLLSPNWEVETAADGEAALARVRESPPDLVLADVMMPKLDGFGLLRAMRADDRLKQTAVILVTARAGEESAIEGLMAGADDHIAKPFSARELVARVGGQLELARMRRESEQRLARDLANAKQLHSVASMRVPGGER